MATTRLTLFAKPGEPARLSSGEHWPLTATNERDARTEAEALMAEAGVTLTRWRRATCEGGSVDGVWFVDAQVPQT